MIRSDLSPPANRVSWRAARPARSRLALSYLLLAAMTVAATAAALAQGEPKRWEAIEWIDVLGESTVFAASLLWLRLILGWRPEGRVTDWLALGLASLAFGFYMDVLDELVSLGGSLWGESLESIFTPAGMLLLTYGIFLLRDEQEVLSRQQRGREEGHRDHREIDVVTDLYDAQYLRCRLEEEIAAARPTTLWMIDLDRFEAVNRSFGFRVGDRVLNRVAQVVLAVAPPDALVCRYAGDRFAVLCRGRRELDRLCPTLNRALTSAIEIVLRNESGATCPVTATAVELRPGPGESARAALARGSRLLAGSRS